MSGINSRTYSPRRRRKAVKLPSLPSLTVWQVILGLAVFMVIPLVVGNPPFHARPFLVLWLLILEITVGLPGLCLLVAWLIRRHIQRHVPLEDVCRNLALEETAVRRFVTEQNIEPRYNIGGKALYRVEDFVEAINLLRPAKEPVEMLRPARRAESVEEVLVRPAEGNSE